MEARAWWLGAEARRDFGALSLDVGSTGLGAVKHTVIWEPQPGPQTALIACPTFEVFYGGSRGGGKTEGSIGDWLDHSNTYGENATGVFFRRKFKQLEEVVARTKALFSQIGARYNEQRAEWVMPNKARLKFRYIERDSDAQEYQGHSYTRVYVEEATNFPTPAPLNLLRATLRSAAGIPVGLRLTGNPGGPGHNWVKARYITPWPKGWKVLKETMQGFAGVGDQEIERVFIPSSLHDNQLLTKNDPMYVARLRQAGSEALVRAWLEGNWDLIDGCFFDRWEEEKHILLGKEWLHKIPDHATRFRALDWGFQRPFAVQWFAVADGEWGLPKDALLMYREWYGSDGRPNTGVRMTADMVARGVLHRESEAKDKVQYGAADPSIFVRDGGPSIAEIMAINGCMWRRADNKRVPGWSEVRRRLDGEGGKPLLYVLDSCEATISTLPTLQHDETNPEDLDTEGEDHAADCLRYACMSRPWMGKAPLTEGIRYPKLPWQMTINELVARQTAKRKSEEDVHG